MPGRWLFASLLGVATISCGPSGRGPEARSISSSSLLPQEEKTLATAVEMKRAGDPGAGWKLLESLPASSPARFDPRYTEVMSAWADTRTHELGTEIAGSKGGGPKAGSVEAEEPPAALTPDQLDDIVAGKRGKLRSACFVEGTKSTSFLLKVRIDEDGRVLDAATSEIKGDALVAECVRKHAASWSFPKNLEGAEHRTRFMFAR